MFIGNSYIEGHDSAQLAWQGGYRKVVEDNLIAAGAEFSFVGANTNNSVGMLNPGHYGFGGQGVDQLFDGIQRGDVNYGSITDWVTPGAADIFVIDLGRKDEEALASDGLKSQLARVSDLIFSTNPSAKLLWMTQVVPFPSYYPNAPVHLANVGSSLAQIQAEQLAASHVMQVVEAPDWDPFQMLDLDGVHPNNEGYVYLGNQLTESLLKTNAVPEPGILLGAAALGGAMVRRRRAKRSAAETAAMN